MTQLFNNSENHGRFNSIVNRAILVGFWTPSISWAWHKIAEPMELAPIAYRQVIHGDRTISSLLLPSGLIIYFLLLNIFCMWILNKWRKDFISLYKEESMGFKDAPLKTSIALIKVTVAVILFGGSAFLASKFVIF